MTQNKRIKQLPQIRQSQSGSVRVLHAEPTTPIRESRVIPCRHEVNGNQTQGSDAAQQPLLQKTASVVLTFHCRKPDDFRDRQKSQNQAKISDFLCVAAKETHRHHKCHDHNTATAPLLQSLPRQKRPRNPANGADLIVVTLTCLCDEERCTEENDSGSHRSDDGKAIPAR